MDNQEKRAANKAQKHQERQAKIKADVDQRIAKATIEKGVLVVVTGNGKGKSTSGFGTVLRAYGHGLKPAVVQFIKGKRECGERNVLQELGIIVEVMGTGFTWETQSQETDIAAAKIAWTKAKKLLADESIDMVLLDELTYMVKYGYIALEEILDVLSNRPKMQHVIITGRGCHRQIIELADTVSEVQPIKHAFKSGIKAQKGLEW